MQHWDTSCAPALHVACFMHQTYHIPACTGLVCTSAVPPASPATLGLFGIVVLVFAVQFSTVHRKPGIICNQQRGWVVSSKSCDKLTLTCNKTVAVAKPPEVACNETDATATIATKACVLPAPRTQAKQFRLTQSDLMLSWTCNLPEFHYMMNVSHACLRYALSTLGPDCRRAVSAFTGKDTRLLVGTSCERIYYLVLGNCLAVGNSGR